IEKILEHFNEGNLPNTSLLLNPIVHEKKGEDYKPLGSGIVWCTSLCLGIDELNDESAERVWATGVHASPFHRGDSKRGGLKIVGFCDEVQPLAADGVTTTGCRELYELANIASDQYAPFYLLS